MIKCFSIKKTLTLIEMDIVSEHPVYRRAMLNTSRAFLSDGAAHFHSKSEKVSDSKHSWIEKRLIFASVSELSFRFNLPRIIAGESILIKVARVTLYFFYRGMYIIAARIRNKEIWFF